ncbi:SDR family NAD(P)-dependent oxidoreductase [Sphingomonas glacialis]|uniref:SDR family oxidoreductase n=1 Tax=Sphingomonas glacialis TaxID=658225 RepID=A0A502G3T3_9SPHN|nr:SDR family oxidoreductase [Sphingomonas glacialis]TPG56394.1 SDR family oxidoreductase [Sphingomonas glacialis]
MSAPNTALVTGASSGIGALYADRLARRGYDLILVARDQARLAALAEKLERETGRTVTVLAADLTDRDDLARVEARIVADPTLTLLVNNAGIALAGGLLDAEAGAVERLIALNITAVAVLAGAAGRVFAERGAGGIINIASVTLLAPERFDGVYSGSKAFVLNLSQSLAVTLEPKGVRVQAVLPGVTRTEIWERNGKDVTAFPPEMVMETEDLVDAALVGFDRGETVTIPPLHDEALWSTFAEARLAMVPFLSRREAGERYRASEPA